MKAAFSILFSLEVTHAYYGGLCPDVTFVMSADVRAALRRGRLIAKTFAGRLYVLYQKASDGTPLVSASGTTIRIGVALANPMLGNFTKFPGTPGSTIAVYDNAADSAALGAPVSAVLTGPVFARTLSKATRPVDVAVVSALGVTVAATTVTAAHDTSSVSFDLTAEPPGRYSISEKYPANQVSTAYYVDGDLTHEPLFAVVETIISDASYAKAAAFSLALDARAETLTYYIVARNFPAADVGALTVADAGFNDDQRPQVTFTKKASDVPASILGDATASVVMFQSDAPVPRRAKGRQKIQLKRNGDVLIANLPQPGQERPTADLVVHVAKPKP